MLCHSVGMAIEDILFLIYVATAVGGMSTIPILKGYHLQKYKEEWDVCVSKFEYLPNTYFYVFGSLFWPLFLIYLGICIPANKIAPRLTNYGKLIAEKEVSLPKLESKRDEHRRELAEAELEVEKFLMSGKK